MAILSCGVGNGNFRKHSEQNYFPEAKTFLAVHFETLEKIYKDFTI